MGTKKSIRSQLADACEERAVELFHRGFFGAYNCMIEAAVAFCRHDDATGHFWIDLANQKEAEELKLRNGVVIDVYEPATCGCEEGENLPY